MMTIRRADACLRKEVMDIFCDIVLFVLLLNIFLRSYSANLNMSFL
jgi:hypothetical protein